MHAVAAALVPSGQGLKQIGELALAFGLAGLIGLEREFRQKSAGLRTHTLVGAGAALFILVSKYGFSDVIGHGVTLDPSRVAAQIVSGIGFIGAGLIFVRSGAVKGLTTAASVWMVVAVGTASGAGLAILALAATAGYFVVVFVFPPLEKALPRSRWLAYSVRILYEDGRGILRQVLRQSTELGYTVASVETHDVSNQVKGVPAVAVTLDVYGQPGVEELTQALEELDGVIEVTASDPAG